MSEISKDILKRFFQNKYSREDYYTLKEFIQNEENKADLEKVMGSHWEEYQMDAQNPNKDFSKVLSEINKISKEDNKTPLLKKSMVYFSRIAAIIVLPLLIATTILYFQFNEYLEQKDVLVEIQSPAGTRTSVNLPDGTKVFLNSGASVKYPSVFNKNRFVELQGEAFFDVESSPEYPFIVKANELLVKATGTEFNVSAYRHDREIDVILQEGTVEILSANNKLLKRMKAGHQLVYNRDNQEFNYLEINANDYTAWINGRLIFKNSSMRDVERRLERWYNVDIEVMNKDLYGLHFKATFVDEEIEEAMKLLKLTSTIDYSIEERHANNDGSFSKRKIKITKK